MMDRYLGLHICHVSVGGRNSCWYYQRFRRSPTAVPESITDVRLGCVSGSSEVIAGRAWRIGPILCYGDQACRQDFQDGGRGFGTVRALPKAVKRGA